MWYDRTHSRGKSGNADSTKHAGTKGLISGSWHTAQNKSEVGLLSQQHGSFVFTNLRNQSDITKVPYVPDRFFWSLHGPKWMMVVEKEVRCPHIHEAF